MRKFKIINKLSFHFKKIKIITAENLRSKDIIIILV
jgi:hypothetical protein